MAAIGSVGSAEIGRQDVDEMLQQPLDRSLQVEACIVFTGQAPAFRPLHHEEVQVMQRAGRPGRKVHEPERPVIGVCDEGSLVDEIDREDRIVAGVALRRQDLDDFLERHRFMFERVRDDAARPIQHLRESRFPSQVRSQHKRIDEQPNEIFRLNLIAPGDLRADRDVRGAGIAMQQRDESGVRQHEQRAPMLAGDQ